jgi:hypothetical protein
MTSFAFAVDAFYDTVRNELGPHPDQPAWRKNRTSRATQVAETLRYRFHIGTQFTDMLRVLVKELFEFRARAVHPSSAYLDTNYRVDVDSGVHPYLLTFSGRNVVQARELTLTLLDKLVARGIELAKPTDDHGWLDRGRSELDRLLTAYPLQ